MKKLLFAAFFVFTINIFPQVMCIAGKKFEMKEIAKRVGIETSIKATFDIVKFKPENIKLSRVQSKNEEFPGEPHHMFVNETIENLKKITFLKDTSNFCLIINYKLKPAAILNVDYAEIISKNEMNLYFAQSNYNTYDGTHKIETFGEDTAFIYKEIDFDSIGEFTEKTDILVERLFSIQNDSVIIIKNNYPLMNDYIKQISREVKQSDFYLPEKRKHFYIRFYIERFIRDCYYLELF